MGAAIDRFAHNSFALLAYAAIVRIYGLQLPFFDRSQGLWGFIGFIQSLLMTFGLTLAACLIGSRIPDWIDSGDRPGHRGFGHSLLSLIIFTIIALLISSLFVDQGFAALYAVALAAGYSSHLVLDFVTYEESPGSGPLIRSTPLPRLCWRLSRRFTRILGFGPLNLPFCQCCFL
jgi:membrane-bound metal-dependent hydrolase YbcI (DUF457 family)